MENTTITREQERQNIVKTIVNKYIEPDQTLCPNLRLYWSGENKKLGAYNKIYSPTMGTIEIVTAITGSFYRRSNENQILRTPCPTFEASYAKFYKKYNVLEITTIEIDANRGKEGEIREWRFGNSPSFHHRLFIFRDSFNIYSENGSIYKEEENGKYYNKYFIKNDLAYLQRSAIVECTRNQIYEFTNHANIINYGYPQEVQSFWTFEIWYKKMMPRQESKTLRDINQVVIDENMIATIDKLYPPEEIKYNDSFKWHSIGITNQTIFTFEKTGDTSGVIRLFRRNSEPPYTSEEQGRIYISSNGKTTKTTLMEKCNGNWIISSRPIGDVFHNTSYDNNEKIIYHNFKKMQEIPALKYIEAMSEDDKLGKNKVAILIDTIRHPFLEKLYKSGFKELAYRVYCGETITANAKGLFGIDIKKNTTLNDIGLNKFQLKYFNDLLYNDGNRNRNGYYYGNINKLILEVKEIVGEDNIIHLDNKTSEFYLKNVLEVIKQMGSWKELLLDENNYRACWTWDKRYYTPTDVDRKHIIKILKLQEKDNRMLRLFSDVIRSLSTICNENRPRVDVYSVKDFEHLNAIHEELNVLVTRQRMEERARWNELEAKRLKELDEHMEKRNKERIEKFEKTGEKFSIVVPKHLKELVEEGAALSHCVGGYTDSVGSGRTNILFLRKNDNITLPFYTIEISNNNQCIQIHGFGNRWLGNNPECIKFVKEWMDERHIKYEKKHLLDTACGYVPSRKFVDITNLGIKF